MHPRAIAAIAMLIVLSLVGCSRSGSAMPNTPGMMSQPTTASGQLTGILPATDLAVGRNQRFMLVLIDTENRVVSDAKVDLAFFKVEGGDQAQLRSQAPTRFQDSPGLPGHGVYVARTDFDGAGQWGVAARVDRPGHDPIDLRLNFEVKDRSSTPAPGAPVPASRTLTGSDPAEIEKFSSARPVDPGLYAVSIDQALQEGKPLAVLFATPGFCTSRLCGPSVEVLQSLRDQFGDSARFIHVEIYKDGRPNQNMDLVPAVREWGLTSEPWLFVVGRDGRLIDKFEGNITVDEVRPVIEAAVRG
jgi:hypothetical protein